jgi:hypothetical protein
MTRAAGLSTNLRPNPSLHRTAFGRPLLGFLDRAMLVDPRAHRMEFWTLSYSYFMLSEMRLSMLLILIVGPNLISQDPSSSSGRRWPPQRRTIDLRVGH